MDEFRLRQFLILLNHLADILQQPLCHIILHRETVRNQDIRHVSRGDIIVQLGIACLPVIVGIIGIIRFYHDTVLLVAAVEIYDSLLQVIAYISACQHKHGFILNILRIHISKQTRFHPSLIVLIVHTQERSIAQLHNTGEVAHKQVGIHKVHLLGQVLVPDLKSIDAVPIAADQILVQPYAHIAVSAVCEAGRQGCGLS